MRGMLPFRTLGLPEEDAYDIYASRFTYVVTTAATNLTSNTIAGATGTLSNTATVTAPPGTTDPTTPPSRRRCRCRSAASARPAAGAWTGCDSC